MAAVLTTAPKRTRWWWRRRRTSRRRSLRRRTLRRRRRRMPPPSPLYWSRFLQSPVSPAWAMFTLHCFFLFKLTKALVFPWWKKLKRKLFIIKFQAEQLKNQMKTMWITKYLSKIRWMSLKFENLDVVNPTSWKTICESRRIKSKILESLKSKKKTSGLGFKVPL